MLPARQAPCVAFVYTLTALAGAVALARLVDVVDPPRERAESIVWSVAMSIVFGASVAVAVLTRREERDERRASGRERASQPQRSATVMSEILALSNGWSLAAVATSIARHHPTDLRDSLALVAALGSLVSVWYFASTVAYAPLARLPDPDAVDRAYEAERRRRGFVYVPSL